MKDQKEPPHPLDGCDPTECYQTMMSERTSLINARREAENNLIKTIVQMSAALIALIAGFAAQSDITFTGVSYTLFLVAVLFLGTSIISGLAEQFFSSRANAEQQKLVEDFYQRVITSFETAPSNRKVAWMQFISFVSFVIALSSVGAFAILEAGENNVRRKGDAAVTRIATDTGPKSAFPVQPSGQVRRR